MDVDQVVLLDPGHPRGDPRHAGHRGVIGFGVIVPFRREDLEGDRQGELVGADRSQR